MMLPGDRQLQCVPVNVPQKSFRGWTHAACSPVAEPLAVRPSKHLKHEQAGQGTIHGLHGWGSLTAMKYDREVV